MQSQQHISNTVHAPTPTLLASFNTSWVLLGKTDKGLSKSLIQNGSVLLTAACTRDHKMVTVWVRGTEQWTGSWVLFPALSLASWLTLGKSFPPLCLSFPQNKIGMTFHCKALWVRVEYCASLKGIHLIAANVKPICHVHCGAWTSSRQEYKY